GTDADLSQASQARLLGVIQFIERFVDILALLPKFIAFFVYALHHQLQLAELSRGLLVDLDDFPDLRDREAYSAPAQDFLKQTTVGCTEQSGPTTPFGMNKALVLVEPKRSGRDAKFPRQFGDGVILIHGQFLFWPLRLFDFYVPVNFCCVTGPQTTTPPGRGTQGSR